MATTHGRDFARCNIQSQRASFWAQAVTEEHVRKSVRFARVVACWQAGRRGSLQNVKGVVLLRPMQSPLAHERLKKNLLYQVETKNLENVLLNNRPNQKKHPYKAVSGIQELIIVLVCAVVLFHCSEGRGHAAFHTDRHPRRVDGRKLADPQSKRPRPASVAVSHTLWARLPPSSLCASELMHSPETP